VATGGGGGGSSFGPADTTFAVVANGGAGGDAQTGDGDPGGDGEASISWLECSTLTVVKTVVNTGGGTAVVADFPLFVDGVPVTSGTPVEVPAGTFQVSETEDPDYVATFGGDCSADGTVTVAVDYEEAPVCTITNVFVPPAPPAAEPAVLTPNYTG
jgi:hypothetical protein